MHILYVYCMYISMHVICLCILYVYVYVYHKYMYVYILCILYIFISLTGRCKSQTHRSHVQSSLGPDSRLKKENFQIFQSFLFRFIASSGSSEKLQAPEKVKHVFISLVNIGRGRREKCERNVLSNGNNKDLPREQALYISY